VLIACGRDVCDVSEVISIADAGAEPGDAYDSVLEAALDPSLFAFVSFDSESIDRFFQGERAVNQSQDGIRSLRSNEDDHLRTSSIVFRAGTSPREDYAQMASGKRLELSERVALLAGEVQPSVGAIDVNYKLLIFKECSRT
jgi:hypothetical protein